MSTGTAVVALQEAIYSTLAANATLTGLSVQIHDTPPDGAAFPYVAIGGWTAVDDDAQSVRGMEHTVTIHAWDDQVSSKRCKQIVGAIIDALHEVDLSLTGHNLVNLRFEFQDVFRDPDGESPAHHGVIRFRAVTEAE